jgi:hypothetical protein
VLPPNQLTDLRVIHGSCRDFANQFRRSRVDDDLISADNHLALKRIHQLFLTARSTRTMPAPCW